MPLDLALFRDKVLGSIELRAGLFSYKYLEGRLEARRDHNTALSGHQGSEAANITATLLETSLIDEGYTAIMIEAPRMSGAEFTSEHPTVYQILGSLKVF